MWLTLCIIFPIISIMVVGGFIYRRKSGVCTCQNRLEGKTVIVTGASAGIGKETAFDFAQRGARVILACRNLVKADMVKEWIISSTGNKNIVTRHLELSDFESIRKFAKEILEKETRLDVLVNNAGINRVKQHFSKQGHDLTLATNHYGHFLLTNLLIELMAKGAPSRIINVTSAAYKYHKNLDLKDLHYKKRQYKFWVSYTQSKLCNVLFTKELACRLDDKGVKNVTVNCVHPGVVNTEIYNKEGQILAHILKFFLQFVTKDSKLGAQTTIHVAVSDKVQNLTGEYFVDCKIARLSRVARDPHLAKELWRISEEEVGLTDEEKYF